MRIAIDARGINWYKGTGIGTYTENVIKNIINIEDGTYYHIYWNGKGYENFKKSNSKILMCSSRYHRFFEENYIPLNIERENIDIYHIPQNGIGLSTYIPCKKIVTIHDLIPYIMPETVGKGYLSKFLKEMPKIMEYADAIITVSEYSKKDIIKYFPGFSNKIFVTPLAADDIYKPMDKNYCKNYLKENYNINDPFILYVGGFSPRKNVKLLIRAFSEFIKSSSKKYKLVLIGVLKDEGDKILKICEELNIMSDIIFPGYIEKEKLPIFYNGSECFVYPSLYEGFGLPPLEAMSCGTPVITSDTSSIPEVTGDAAIKINPSSIYEIADAIGNVTSSDNLKNSLSMKGLERAKLFSWEKTAEKTLNIYKHII